MNNLENVTGFLLKARQLELAIDADRLLSDEGKAAKKSQHVAPLFEAARWSASKWLKSTRRDFAQAQERELKARQSAAGRVNIEARSYALARAKLLAENSTSWDAIAGAMAEAVSLGDDAALHAWRDLEPLVRSRFDGGRSGEASAASSGLRATFNRLDAALAAQVDPAVAAAQAELAVAQDALADAEGSLSRIDRRRGYAGEGPPLFKDLVHPIATVETGGPGDPLGWSFETAGGAFGKSL